VTASLPTNPTACTAGQFATDIAADGTLTCGTPAGSYQAQAIYDLGTVSGTNTYTATASPTLSAYANPQYFTGIFTNANTSTTPTLNVTSLGAVTIVKADASVLEVGSIPAGKLCLFYYDGTHMRLLNPTLKGVISGDDNPTFYNIADPTKLLKPDLSSLETSTTKIITMTIASGALALATSAISSQTCQTITTNSVNSAAAAGVLTTDIIEFTPNGSIKAITGYAPLTTGGLTIAAYPTAGYVNFDVCNWSASAITPGAVTINWRVVR
jgi:hypothetical protein